MRKYLNAAALVAFLVGSGLALTGYGNAWVGFACFYVAGSMLLYNALETANVKKLIRKRSRRFLLAAIIAVSIFSAWRRMNNYATEKAEVDAISKQLLARFSSGELKPQPSLPGASVHMLLSIHEQTLNRKQYIFDFGRPSAGQLSAYLSPNNVFMLVLTDRKGESFELPVSIGPSGIPMDRFIYLMCDVGRSETETFIRVLVNGEVKADRTLPFKVDFEWPGSPGGIIGNDSITHSNGASLTILRFLLYNRTLTNDDVLQVLKVFKSRYSLFGGPNIQKN